jgi:hypothetical protein
MRYGRQTVRYWGSHVRRTAAANCDFRSMNLQDDSDGRGRNFKHTLHGTRPDSCPETVGICCTKLRYDFGVVYTQSIWVDAPGYCAVRRIAQESM